MRWVLPTMRAFWNILFIRICVDVIEKNKVYKDSYRRLGILRYIFENIQDDSVRWYPSVTKTSRQISAHFLQHSSLWMNRSAQCELYNSCLYFFKVLLHYIVLCNFFYVFVNECHLKTNWAHMHCLFRRFKDGRSKNNYHCFLDHVPSDNKSTAEHSR